MKRGSVWSRTSNLWAFHLILHKYLTTLLNFFRRNGYHHLNWYEIWKLIPKGVGHIVFKSSHGRSYCNMAREIQLSYQLRAERQKDGFFWPARPSLQQMGYNRFWNRNHIQIFILCSMLTFFRDVILPFFSYLSGKGLNE